MSGEPGLLTCCSTLSWLLLAPEAFGADFSACAPNQDHTLDIWQGAACQRFGIDLPELRERLREASGRAWWDILHILATQVVTLSARGDAPALTWKPLTPTELRRARLLPPELLWAALDRGDPDRAWAGVIRSGGSAPNPRSTHDHHVHLSGAIPDQALWAAATSGLVTFPEGLDAPGRVGDLNSHTTLAGFDRLGLFLSFRKDASLARWKELDEQHRGDLPLNRREALLPFFTEQGWHAPDGVGGPASLLDDPLAVAQGCSSSATEVWLLRHALGALRSGTTDPWVRERAGRYLHRRLAWRESLIASPHEPGLDALLALLARRGHRAGSKRLWHWEGAQAGRFLRAGGTRSADLRASFDRKPGTAKDQVLTWITELKSQGVEPHLVHQLHRGHEPPGDLKSLRILSDQDAGGFELASQIVGLDLVGNEREHPPDGWRDAWHDVPHLRWHVHAGEACDHVWEGLLNLLWCVETLRMRPNDRIGHALSLIAPLRSVWMEASRWVTLQDRVMRAIGWTWAPPLSSGGWLHTPVSSKEREITELLRHRVLAALSESGVVLEACPSSNLQVAGAEELAFPAHLHAHLPWVVGTDDPAALGTTLDEEFVLMERCRRGPHDGEPGGRRERSS